MPSLMQRYGLKRIDLLKIDIEGAEAELFGDTCESWIDRVVTIVMELHEDRLPIGELERRMSRYGFSVRRSPKFHETGTVVISR
jgi:hypothetical protein